MKATEILDLRVEFVSYVGKAANKKKFFIVKSEDASPEPNVIKPVHVIVRKDTKPDEPHLIYGIVYSPGEVDSQGEFMSVDEILKAQHQFLKDYRLIDTEHNKIPGAGEVVECYCSLTDMKIGDEEIVKGSWILATEPDNETWEAIEKGEYTGYSMYGWAGKKVETEVHKETIWDRLKSLFKVEKDFNSELYNYENTDFWHLFDIFTKACLTTYFEGGLEPQEYKQKLITNLEQLLAKVKKMTFERVEKATYECECIKCGYKMKSKKHCKDIKCPKCGGTMRRVERPGAGQETEKGDLLLEEVSKPYPNEHSCRLKDPKNYSTCRKTSRTSDGKKYNILTCQRKDDKTKWEEQGYRYPKDTWTAAEAKKHCEKHKGIKFEPAKKVKKGDVTMNEELRKEVEELFKSKFDEGMVEINKNIDEVKKSIPEKNEEELKTLKTKVDEVSKLTDEFETIKGRLEEAEKALLISKSSPTDTEPGKPKQTFGIKTKVI